MTLKLKLALNERMETSDRLLTEEGGRREWGEGERGTEGGERDGESERRERERDRAITIPFGSF